jgi:hypothetical protein
MTEIQLIEKTELIKRIDPLVEKYFWDGTTGHNCAATVLLVVCEYFKITDNLIPRVAAAFGGGCANTHRSLCGGLSGGLLAIGVMKDEGAADLGQEMLVYAKEKYKSWDCDSILNIDFDNENQVQQEQIPKRSSICKPLIKDLCVWLVLRLS